MIPTPRHLTPDARRAANRLVDERLIEQAKGALMLRFGVDSHQAFAVLLGWARTSHTPVAVIAHALLRGICEGSPQTEVRQRALVRWLEAQLRDGLPDHAQLQTSSARWRSAT